MVDGEAMLRAGKMALLVRVNTLRRAVLVDCVGRKAAEEDEVASRSSAARANCGDLNRLAASVIKNQEQ